MKYSTKHRKRYVKGYRPNVLLNIFSDCFKNLIEKTNTSDDFIGNKIAIKFRSKLTPEFEEKPLEIPPITDTSPE